MSPPQLKAYNEMAENLFTELTDGETASARVAVSRLMKLREITGGFVIDDNGKAVPIGNNSKLKELELLLDQILGDPGNKVIIWIQYRWEAATIIRKFAKKYGACGLYGAITQKQKDINIERFLNDTKTRVLVCHPQSAAHGLTLTVAAYSIYYSLSHNFEDYYQSSKRIYRSGQTKPVFYYFITANNSIDETLLTCIQGKKNVQDLLVDGTLDPEKILGVKKQSKGATHG
jgi:SNF2 family DNA or RNA helicase